MYIKDSEGVERRVLPAAALREWDIVHLPGRGRSAPFTIARIYHAAPAPGDITLVDEAMLEEVVGGSQLIEIVALSSNEHPIPSPEGNK